MKAEGQLIGFLTEITNFIAQRNQESILFTVSPSEHILAAVERVKQ
jgi:hypothetical protein